jgi:hypothetical protein
MGSQCPSKSNLTRSPPGNSKANHKHNYASPLSPHHKIQIPTRLTAQRNTRRILPLTKQNLPRSAGLGQNPKVSLATLERSARLRTGTDGHFRTRLPSHRRQTPRAECDWGATEPADTKATNGSVA